MPPYLILKRNRPSSEYVAPPELIVNELLVALVSEPSVAVSVQAPVATVMLTSVVVNTPDDAEPDTVPLSVMPVHVPPDLANVTVLVSDVQVLFPES